MRSLRVFSAQNSVGPVPGVRVVVGRDHAPNPDCRREHEADEDDGGCPGDDVAGQNQNALAHLLVEHAAEARYEQRGDDGDGCAPALDVLVDNGLAHWLDRLLIPLRNRERLGLDLGLLARAGLVLGGFLARPCAHMLLLLSTALDARSGALVDTIKWLFPGIARRYLCGKYSTEC